MTGRRNGVPDRNCLTGQLGQSGQACQHRTSRAWQPGQDSQGRTDRRGLPRQIEKDLQDSNAGTGLQGQDCQHKIGPDRKSSFDMTQRRKARTGLPEGDRQQDRQNETGGRDREILIVRPWNKQNIIARTGFQGQQE